RAGKSGWGRCQPWVPSKKPGLAASRAGRILSTIEKAGHKTKAAGSGDTRRQGIVAADSPPIGNLRGTLPRPPPPPPPPRAPRPPPAPPAPRRSTPPRGACGPVVRPALHRRRRPRALERPETPARPGPALRGARRTRRGRIRGESTARQGGPDVPDGVLAHR